MTYLVFGCRCLLLVVFAGSAIGKLGSFTAFCRATRELVPAARGVATQLAAAVIVGELIVVLLLAVPATAPAGLVTGAGLLVAFTVAIAAALGRGSTTSCNCFGRSASPIGARHLVRNGFLILVAAIGLIADVLGWPAGVESLGLAMTGVVAVVLAVLVLSFDALADLFAGPVHRDLERIPR